MRGWHRTQALALAVLGAALVAVAVCSVALLIGGQRRAAVLLEREHGVDVGVFDQWLQEFHKANPTASLSAEEAAWHDRQYELQKIAAWERGVREGLPAGTPWRRNDPLHDDETFGDDSVASFDLPWGEDSSQVEDVRVRVARPDFYRSDGTRVVEEDVGLPKRGRGVQGTVPLRVSEEDAPPVPNFDETPATVTEPPQGPPDFNGMDAILANHPDMGLAPTDLDETHGESRGSFSVRLAREGRQGEGEVSLAVYGPASPFQCTLRGYRKLSADFGGNSVYTGFERTFSGTRMLATGFLPGGVQGEYDILACRDETTGEVQYFKYSLGAAQ
jgi:hypothetical protein